MSNPSYPCMPPIPAPVIPNNYCGNQIPYIAQPQQHQHHVQDQQHQHHPQHQQLQHHQQNQQHPQHEQHQQYQYHQQHQLSMPNMPHQGIPVVFKYIAPPPGYEHFYPPPHPPPQFVPTLHPRIPNPPILAPPPGYLGPPIRFYQMPPQIIYPEHPAPIQMPLQQCPDPNSEQKNYILQPTTEASPVPALDPEPSEFMGPPSNDRTEEEEPAHFYESRRIPETIDNGLFKLEVGKPIYTITRKVKRAFDRMMQQEKPTKDKSAIWTQKPVLNGALRMGFQLALAQDPSLAEKDELPDELKQAIGEEYIAKIRNSVEVNPVRIEKPAPHKFNLKAHFVSRLPKVRKLPKSTETQKRKITENGEEETSVKQPRKSGYPLYVYSNRDHLYIGPNGTIVPTSFYTTIPWNSSEASAKALMEYIFDQENLATHGLDGDYILDLNIVDDIVTHVAERCCVDEDLVSCCIANLCNEYKRKAQEK